MAVTKVRIGVQSARELELEVEDGEAVAEQLEAALNAGEAISWLVDARGDRHGIAISKLVFVQVEGEADRRGVGFAALADEEQ